MMMVWGVQARVSLAYMIPSASRSSKHLAGNAVHKETSVQEGSSATKKGGVSEDVKSMLTCLQKHFPDEVSLDRVLGTRKKKAVVSAAEEYTELLEADFYQDMPILPTSKEMLGQCAFEMQDGSEPRASFLCV